MTRPNPARLDHPTLKILEAQVSTEQSVSAVPGATPGPSTDPTDVTWASLRPGDHEIIHLHMATDNGSPIVRVPLWTSFAIPDPADSVILIFPLLEETQQ